VDAARKAVLFYVAPRRFCFRASVGRAKRQLNLHQIKPDRFRLTVNVVLEVLSEVKLKIVNVKKCSLVNR
jgi:hypothetical protein